jgi:hypothetical protein
LFFREHHSSNLSFGWSDGGRATNFLEDLGADAPATVTRAEFGMCAGHGVRSPTSSKVQEAGPSHGLGRGRSFASQPWRLPAVSLACWARGHRRGSGHRHFSKVQRLGLCTTARLVVLTAYKCCFDCVQVVFLTAYNTKRTLWEPNRNS